MLHQRAARCRVGDLYRKALEILCSTGSAVLLDHDVGRELAGLLIVKRQQESKER